MKLEPQNSLESSLKAVMADRITVRDFLSTLLLSNVYVPSKKALDENGHMTPHEFHYHGGTFVAVFTSLSRTVVCVPVASCCVQMTGADLVRWASSSFGIVLNPRWDVGLEIPLAGVRQVFNDMMADASLQ